MCLNPKLTYHPYHIINTGVAKDIYLLGVKVTKQEFYEHDLEWILSQMRDSSGRIEPIEFRKACDSTFAVNSLGEKLPLLLLLNCNRCIECSRQYRSDIVSRCLIEAAHSAHVFFYTLTYDDDHVPTEGLVKSHVSSAFKLFREQFSRYCLNGKRLDFTQIYVGEYGSDHRYSMRPHYHGLIFIKDHLTDSQLVSFFDFFKPKSNPNKISKVQDGVRSVIECSDFYNEEIHSDLQHWWPHGVLFDLEAPKKNVVALSKYVSKYITKQFVKLNNLQIEAFETIKYPTKSIISDRDINPYCVKPNGDICRFQHDGKSPLEGHRNPTFVQMPKRVGLACRYLDEYADFIKKSNSPTMQLCIEGAVYRFAIPRIYIRKLFPTASQLCPNITFYYKLFTSLIYKLSSLVDRLVSLSESDMFLFRADKVEKIKDFLTPQLEAFSKKISSLSIYSKLAISKKKYFLLEFMKDVADTLSIGELYQWIFEIFNNHIIFAPDSNSFHILTSLKRRYFADLSIPDFSYNQQVEQSLAKNRYDEYVNNKLMFSVYDSFR